MRNDRFLSVFVEFRLSVFRSILRTYVVVVVAKSSLASLASNLLQLTALYLYVNSEKTTDRERLTILIYERYGSYRYGIY